MKKHKEHVKFPREELIKEFSLTKGTIQKSIFRFANLVVPQAGAMMKKKSPNWHAGRKDILEEETKK